MRKVELGIDRKFDFRQTPGPMSTTTATPVDDYVSPQTIALALKVSPRTVIRNADLGKYGVVRRTVGSHRRISLAAALAAHPS